MSLYRGPCWQYEEDDHDGLATECQAAGPISGDILQNALDLSGINLTNDLECEMSPEQTGTIMEYFIKLNDRKL